MNRTEIAHIKALAGAFARSIRWVGKIPAAIMTLGNIPVSTIVDDSLGGLWVLAENQMGSIKLVKICHRRSFPVPPRGCRAYLQWHQSSWADRKDNIQFPWGHRAC